MVGVVTVLPDLSVDYGVLRAFQEALIVIAAVLVAGSLTAFSPLGPMGQPDQLCHRHRHPGLHLRAAAPGAGAYPAQLALNNSGQYYDTTTCTPRRYTP